MPNKKMNWDFMRQSLKIFFRTVKPWRSKGITSNKFSVKTWEGAYEDGWNNCLKEMKKNELNWFKKMDKLLK